MNSPEEIYLRDRKIYGYLASLPLLIAIIHLFFSVFFMTIINYHEDTNQFTNLYTMGEMFSSSVFSCLLCSLKPSLAKMKAVPSIVGLCVGLVLIFLSTSAVKGKKISYYISFATYGLDTLMIIPTLIINSALDGNFHLAVYDIILMIVLHVFFLGVFAYGCFVIRRIDKFEEQKTFEENSIHIEKGKE
jgi:hypothetical protein